MLLALQGLAAQCGQVELPIGGRRAHCHPRGNGEVCNPVPVVLGSGGGEGPQLRQGVGQDVGPRVPVGDQVLDEVGEAVLPAAGGLAA